MKKHFALALLPVLACLTQPAVGATITTFYGDADGFGIGATSGVLNPGVSNASPGEAAGTDVRLIGNSGGFVAPAFTPTGGFAAFTPFSSITSAILTIRMGSFVPTEPVDGPNVLLLDGLAVNPAFLNSFTGGATDLIDTRSFALAPSFYAALLDGAVSLNGTQISEGSGFGSFQIDFLSLEITGTLASAVPEPSTWAMLLTGFAGIGMAARRRSARRLSLV
jgi:PEP-CTERM motif